MENHLNNLRVMVVDDQGTMRSIIRQLLHQVGVKHTKEAANGIEAINELQNNGTVHEHIDLIICDLYMDKMDGITFIREIRKGSVLRYKDIPILILTGNNDPLIEDVVLQVGATKVLRKPISANTLGLEIKKHTTRANNASPLNDANYEELFRNGQFEEYKSGDTIFSQGSEGRNVYIVASGKVGLYKKIGDETVPFDIIEKNCIFGEMAFFDDKHRVFTAIAIDDTKCFVVKECFIKSQFDASPLLMQILLQGVSKTAKTLIKAINNECYTRLI